MDEKGDAQIGKGGSQLLEEFSGQPIRHSASFLEYYVCSDSGKYQIGGTVSRKGAEKKEEISGNIE